MSSPYVCAICGQPITSGRHKSGWRHSSNNRSDHRVRPIRRDEFSPISDDRTVVNETTSKKSIVSRKK